MFLSDCQNHVLHSTSHSGIFRVVRYFSERTVQPSSFHFADFSLRSSSQTVLKQPQLIIILKNKRLLTSWVRCPGSRHRLKHSLLYNCDKFLQANERFSRWKAITEILKASAPTGEERKESFILQTSFSLHVYI